MPPTTLTRDQVAPIHTLPDCALHPGVPAVVDAKTTSGPWGNLCLRCFSSLGIGLGMGLGQVLVPVEPPHHMGDFTAPCHACGATWAMDSMQSASIRHSVACLYNAAITSFPELY